MLRLLSLKRCHQYRSTILFNMIISRSASSVRIRPIQDVVQSIETSDSAQQLYDYFTTLSVSYVKTNNFLISNTLSKINNSFNDITITMKLYEYLLNNNIPLTTQFYTLLFEVLTFDGSDLNLDLIHNIIKQMSIHKIDLNVTH
eukprot:546100_1